MWPQHPRGISHPLLTLSHRERQQGSKVVVGGGREVELAEFPHSRGLAGSPSSETLVGCGPQDSLGVGKDVFPLRTPAHENLSRIPPMWLWAELGRGLCGVTSVPRVPP